MYIIEIEFYKMVEAQFDKLEKEVKKEVEVKMSKMKEIRKANLQPQKPNPIILDKSKNFRKNETKRKLNFSKQIESNIDIQGSKKIDSFKNVVESQKENNVPDIKFEVLEKKFKSTSSPLIRNRTNSKR